MVDLGVQGKQTPSYGLADVEDLAFMDILSKSLKSMVLLMG